jgi:hypothetical protein
MPVTSHALLDEKQVLQLLMQEHRSILQIVLYLSEEIYIGYFCYVLPLSLAASDGFMV